MEIKAPVLLAVMIETGQGRWFAAGIDLDGQALPLVRSETGNLNAYHNIEFDEQVSFLRHRLSGVLQIACDRLWGKNKKPCQIVFITDACFPNAPDELTQRVAEHFVEWMTRPPVVFFVADQQFSAETSPALKQLAGEIAADHYQVLTDSLPQLCGRLLEADDWEAAPRKKAQGE
jgi:hypothetical protein